MKKTLFSNFLILLVASTLSLPNTLAEDPTQWNLPEGAKACLGKGKITEILYSPDGKFLAVWDIDTGKAKMLLTAHTDRVQCLAFSPDGKTLASGNRDKTIYIWNVHTGEQKKTLTGHTDWVRSIAFSPDGKTLVSGSGDGSVLLWKIKM